MKTAVGIAIVAVGTNLPELVTSIVAARRAAGSPSPFPRWRDDPHGLWREWITRGCFPWEQEGYPFWGNLHHTASYWPSTRARSGDCLTLLLGPGSRTAG